MTLEEQLAESNKQIKTLTAQATQSKTQFDQLTAQLTAVNDKTAVSNAEKKALADKLKTIETAELEKTNNFKTLWENEKTRADDAVLKASKTQDAFFETVKLSQIESEANKIGIDSTYMDFLKNTESKSVITETTSTGSINVIGAKEFVEGFKVKFPKMFKDDAAPNVNNGGGGAGGDKDKGGGELSGDELLALQEKDPELYNKTMKELM